eukprot:m51a1_g5015 hypothetical protein (978) ;mRNA; f:273787-277527
MAQQQAQAQQALQQQGAGPASYEQVLGVIRVLYSQSDNASIRQANDWLDAWQKSPGAWTVAEQLLRDPNVNATEALFGAITLHAKARSEGHTLPPQDRTALRDALLGHIARAAPTRKPRDGGLVRVACAVAALAVHMEEWQDPVRYLISTYGSSLQTLRAALMVLNALPEEGTSHRVSATRTRRDAFSRQLDGAAPDLLQFLYAWLTRAHEAGATPEAAAALQGEILRCVSSWLHASRVSPAVLVASPMSLAAFEALAQPQLLEVAIDVVCEFVRLSEAVLARDPAQGHQLLAFVVPRVLALAPAYRGAAGSALAVGLCRLFAEVGERYVEFVSCGSAEAMALVGVLLECTACDDDEVASMTFNFWHELSKFLVMLPDEQRAQRSAPFGEAFGRLVDVIVRHMVLPEDYDQMGDDEREEIKNYRRYDLAHTLRDSCGVIGSEQTLERIVGAFMDQARTYDGSDWRGLEAALYAARSTARCVELTDSSVLPQLLEKLPQLPREHKLLQYTSILVVGRYAEWFCKHPDKLPPLLAYVTSGLGDKELASASATAFKNLAASCGSAMTTYAESVLQLYEQCTQALQAKMLGSDDVADILKGVGSVVVMMQPQAYTSAVERLCAPAANALAAALNAARQSGAALPQAQVAEMLRQLGLVLRFCKPLQDVPRAAAHPCMPVLERLWPMLGAVLETYAAADDDVVDELTRCYRCAISCAGAHASELATALLRSAEQLYRQKVSSSMLVLMNTAVEVLAFEDELALPLAQVASAMMATTTQALSSTPDALQQQAEVVLELFELGMACVGRLPDLFLRSQPPLIAPLLRWSLAALGVQHRDAINAALAFIEHNYRAATKQGYDAAVHAAAATPALIRGLLACAGGVQPFNRLPEIRNALVAIRNLDPARACFYAAAALGVAPPAQAAAAAAAAGLTPPQMGPFPFRPPQEISADVVGAMGNAATRDSEFLRILEDFASASRRSAGL